jgi:hypothetical protein
MKNKMVSPFVCFINAGRFGTQHEITSLIGSVYEGCEDANPCSPHRKNMDARSIPLENR